MDKLDNSLVDEHTKKKNYPDKSLDNSFLGEIYPDKSEPYSILMVYYRSSYTVHSKLINNQLSTIEISTVRPSMRGIPYLMDFLDLGN